MFAVENGIAIRVIIAVGNGRKQVEVVRERGGSEIGWVENDFVACGGDVGSDCVGVVVFA